VRLAGRDCQLLCPRPTKLKGPGLPVAEASTPMDPSDCPNLTRELMDRSTAIFNLPDCCLELRGKFITLIEEDYQKKRRMARLEAERLHVANLKKIEKDRADLVKKQEDEARKAQAKKDEDARNEELKQQHKVKEQAEYKRFVQETFVVETDAGPISLKEFKSLWSAYVKANRVSKTISIDGAIEYIKKFINCATGGKNYNNTEFWGIRTAVDEDNNVRLLQQMP